MSMVKKVTSRAFHSGWIKKDPFIGFSLGCKPVERPFLEQYEIEAMMNLRPESKKLEPEREGIEPSEILYFTVVMSFSPSLKAL